VTVFDQPGRVDVGKTAEALAGQAAHAPGVAHVSRPEASPDGWVFVVTRDDGDMFSVGVAWRAPRITFSACGDDVYQGSDSRVYDSSGDPCCWADGNKPHQPRKAGSSD
jgi:hypothetical protein